VGLGTMGVLALGWVADHFGILFVFDILVVLPIMGFILTLFIKEPGRLKKEKYVPKSLSHTRN
jgi:FSR family fosmidomycin resistance protein-like MFS transporter